MKAILEFDMEDVGDREAHKRAVQGIDLTMAIHTVLRAIGSRMKHGDLGEEAFGELKSIRDQLLEDTWHLGLDVEG